MKLKTRLGILALIIGTSIAQQASDPSKSDKEASKTDGKLATHSVKKVPVDGRFQKALKYIDSNGAYLSLNDVSIESAFLMEIAEFFQLMLNQNMKGLDLSLKDIIQKTRIDRIAAVAASVKKVEGAWNNKTFYDLGGTQDGIFKLLKGLGKEWSAYSFAPTGTDFIKEFDLNIDNVRNTLSYLMTEAKPDSKKRIMEGFEAMVAENKELEMFLNGVHVRISMIAKLDPKKAITAPSGVRFPNVDVAIKMEGIYPLFERYEKDLIGVMQKKKKNGLVYYSPKQKIGPISGVPEISPLLVLDPTTKIVWLSAREPFLRDCLSDGPKLKDDPNFKNLMRHMSSNGNLLFYLSREVVGEFKKLYDSNFRQMIKKGLIENTTTEADKLVASLMLNFLDQNLFPALMGSRNGFAYTLDLNQDGLLISSRTPIPMKGSYGNSSFMMVPALAAISSPIILRQISRSRATAAISNAKDIYVACREYAFNNSGRAPMAGARRSANQHLRLLFSRGVCLDEYPFYVKGVKGFNPPDGRIKGLEALSAGENIWAYVPGRSLTNDRADTPLLMAPFTKLDGGTWQFDKSAFGGQLIILRTDGSAQAITVTEDSGGLYDPEGQLVYQNGKAYLMDQGQRKAFPLAMPESN